MENLKRNNCAGISLIETVLSIGILAVGFVSIMQAISFSSNTASLASTVNLAVNDLIGRYQELEHFEMKQNLGNVEKNQEFKKNNFVVSQILSDESSGTLMKAYVQAVIQKQSKKTIIEFETVYRK